MQFFKSFKNTSITSERISGVLHMSLAVAMGLATLATALNSAALWGCAAFLELGFASRGPAA